MLCWTDISSLSDEALDALSDAVFAEKDKRIQANIENYPKACFDWNSSDFTLMKGYREATGLPLLVCRAVVKYYRAKENSNA